MCLDVLTSTVKIVTEATSKWWRLNEVMPYAEEPLACGENSINAGRGKAEDDRTGRRGWMKQEGPGGLTVEAL